MTPSQLQEHIFSVSESNFESLALEIFRFQFEQNPVYATFAKGIGKIPEHVKSIKDIPFLPVELFKTHKIYSAEKEPEIVFTSSGTTGAITSTKWPILLSIEKVFVVASGNFMVNRAIG